MSIYKSNTYNFITCLYVVKRNPDRGFSSTERDGHTCVPGRCTFNGLTGSRQVGCVRFGTRGIPGWVGFSISSSGLKLNNKPQAKPNIGCRVEPTLNTLRASLMPSYRHGTGQRSFERSEIKYNNNRKRKKAICCSFTST